MTQPGRSVWAAVVVTLFWGKHCWQDIQWNRDIFQLHQLHLRSHSAPDLVAAGAWRSSKSSLWLQDCLVAQYQEELLRPAGCTHWDVPQCQWDTGLTRPSHAMCSGAAAHSLCWSGWRVTLKCPEGGHEKA